MTQVNRRNFLKMAAGAAAATGLGLDPLAKAGAQVPVGATRPNVLYVLTDQLTARALSCYGATDIDTPHIDALAKTGTLLRSAFTNSGVCTPSRAALTTGFYAWQTGASKNSKAMTHIADDPAMAPYTFGHLTTDAGYRTMWLGKWHLSGGKRPGKQLGENSGFENTRYLWNRGHWKTFEVTKDGYKVSQKVSTRHYPTRSLTRRAIRWMRPTDKPWFCVISYPDPHTPLGIHEPYKSMYKGAEIALPEGWDMPGEELPKFVTSGGSYLGPDIVRRKEKIISRSRRYYGLVKAIDDQVGVLVDFLKRSGQLDNTIILVSSDHGELNGEYARNAKSVPLPGTYRIPMIWSGPGIAAQQRSELFGAIDLFPTLASLTGASFTTPVMGNDQSAMLQGGSHAGDGRLFFHGQREDLVGVISDEWFVGLTQNKGTAVQNRGTGEMTFTVTDPINGAAPTALLADLRDHLADVGAPHGKWDFA